MTDAVKLSDLKYPNLQGDGSRRSETSRHKGRPRQTRAARAQASASSPRETESPLVPDSLSGLAAASQQPCELDRLYRSLAEVTPQNHPRRLDCSHLAAARLLRSSSRKPEKWRSRQSNIAREAWFEKAPICSTTSLHYGIAPASIQRMCGSRCAPAPTRSALPKSCPKPAATIGVAQSRTSRQQPKLNRNKP